MTIFYHNITKGQLNETSLSDFIEKYEHRDIVAYTAEGCAILNWLTPKEMSELNKQYKLMHPDDEE